jgi:predicted phage terminase large subunit-like protein
VWITRRETMNRIEADLLPGLEGLLDLVGPLRLRHCPITPTFRQEAFLRLTCPEALFGGAAGGGKSVALLASAAQFTDVPGYNALLLRTTLRELEQPGGLIDLAEHWFGPTKASWSGEQRAWRFPAGTRSGAGGASVRFGFLDGQRDVNRYAGSSYSFVGFDELSQVDEISYRRMFRVLRQANTGSGLGRAPDGLTLAEVPVRVRATSNPGGPNHGWIKLRLVDPDTREPGVVFIPSRWSDNPHLDLESYEKQLAHLPITEQKRLRDGNWDVADEGEIFRREWFQLVDAAAVPEQTRAVRYWDFASSQPTLANPDPDFTVGLLLELDDRTGIYYITGIVRRRAHAGQIEQLVLATAESDGDDVKIYLEQEPASNSEFMVDHFKREVLRGFAVYSHRPSGSKEARARIAAAAAENGYVKLVPGPHTADFLDEVAAFPHAAHDDLVDAFTGAHQRNRPPPPLRQHHPQLRGGREHLGLRRRRRTRLLPLPLVQRLVLFNTSVRPQHGSNYATTTRQSRGRRRSKEVPDRRRLPRPGPRDPGCQV